MKLRSLLLALCITPAMFASTAQLHFDEFGADSLVNVNGVDIGGVSFQFAGGAAFYNGSIGSSGSTALVSDPLLVGDTTGSLTIIFAEPTPVLNFDIVMAAYGFIPAAYTVTIPGHAPFVEDTNSLVFFSEGEFVYNGPTPVSAAVVSFSNSAPQFGLDNLTFDTPEPGFTVLIGGVILTLAGCLRRRGRQ